MKVTVVHGQMHDGSTRKLTELFLKELGDVERTDFDLPADGPGFCSGCMRCFKEGRDKCNDHGKVSVIVDSILDSDVFVFETPTYCMGPTAQMKALIDHMGYLYMSHRPDGRMFHKSAVAVSTCAGRGSKQTVDYLTEQFMLMGVPHTFGIGPELYALDLDSVSEKKRNSIMSDVRSTASKVRSSLGKAPGTKFKFIYGLMLKNQETNEWNPLDRDHWKENGWLDGKKPWE